jgi:hypothetical protein
MVAFGMSFLDSERGRPWIAPFAAVTREFER